MQRLTSVPDNQVQQIELPGKLMLFDPERINDLQALGVTGTTRRPDLLDSDIIITMFPMTLPCGMSSLDHSGSRSRYGPA